MPNELYYQTEIVKSVRAAGGYAEKLSHRFKVGIPDLFVKWRAERDPAVIEVKKLEGVNRDGSFPIDTTPLQRKSLRDMRAAGLRVGVLVVIAQGPGKALMVWINDIESRKATLEGLEPWTVMRRPKDDWGLLLLNLVRQPQT